MRDQRSASRRSTTCAAHCAELRSGKLCGSGKPARSPGRLPCRFTVSSQRGRGVDRRGQHSRVSTRRCRPTPHRREMPRTSWPTAPRRRGRTSSSSERAGRGRSRGSSSGASRNGSSTSLPARCSRFRRRSYRPKDACACFRVAADACRPKKFRCRQRHFKHLTGASSRHHRRQRQAHVADLVDTALHRRHR